MRDRASTLIVTKHDTYFLQIENLTDGDVYKGIASNELRHAIHSLSLSQKGSPNI